MNIILLLRTGGDFHITDVNLIVHHLKKTWRGNDKLNIYCLHNGVENPINLTDFDLIPLPKPHFPGWWSKMHLFNPYLSYARPFLFLDLDTALLNKGVSDLIPNEHINSFITLEDFYRQKKVGSGIMYIPKNNPKIDKIWESWKINTYDHINTFRGDQNFIENVVTPDAFWQDITNNRISSFKPKGTKWLTDLPNKIDIVCFHGQPRIPQAAKNDIKWVYNYVKDYE